MSDLTPEELDRREREYFSAAEEWGQQHLQQYGDFRAAREAWEERKQSECYVMLRNNMDHRCRRSSPEQMCSQCKNYDKTESRLRAMMGEAVKE